MHFLQLPPSVIVLITRELTPADLSSLLRSNHCLKELLTPVLLQIPLSAPKARGRRALKIAAEAGGVHAVQSLARVGLLGLLNEGYHMAHIYPEQTPKGIRTLLNSGIFSIDARDSQGRTPLFIAAAYNLNAVRCLLAHGAQPNVTDLADSTPLMEAAKRNSAEIVRVLLQDKRTKVNQVDWTGCTALYLAAGWGCAEAVAAMLEDRRTDINLEAWLLGIERKYNTPLKIARAHGHTQVVEMLLVRPDIIDGERPGPRPRARPGYFGN